MNHQTIYFFILINFIQIAWNEQISAQFSEQELLRIEAKLDSISAVYNIPSIGYSIATSDGVLTSGAIGFANVEEGLPAGSKTVYRVGSVTKSFIALGILNLVEEGLLSLEDPVTELVPELDIQNRWKHRSPVLLKHLLEHTAGFRDIYLKEYAVEIDTYIPPLNEIVQRHPEYWISRWEPGTRHAYSNCGYTLLGLIIEKTTGMPYEDYLTKVILDPVGMVNSDFRGQDHSSLAYSYDEKGNRQIPFPLMEHPAGYLHSTPEDMGRFVHFIINKTVVNDEPLISEDLFRKMNRPLSIIGADERMVGYGLANVTIFARGHLGQGHSGGIDHYLSNYNYFEEAGVGFYYTMTHMSMEAFEAINNLFYELFLPDIDQILPPYQLYEFPEELTGWYSAGSYRIELLRIVDELLDPIRVYLDGEMSVYRAFNKELEEEYVVVHWDQRGAGKSNHSGFSEETMTLDQFIEDAHHLTQYLKARFDQKKIFLLGHSWGTQLGILTVLRYPDDYHAYISVSQVVHPRRADEISYTWLKQQVDENGSRRQKRKFEELGQLFFDEHDRYVTFAKMKDSFGGGMDVGMSRLVWISFGAKEYTIGDYARWLRGANRGSGPMWEELRDYDLFRDVPSLSVPVWFIVGENDYNTPAELVEEYYRYIDAPEGKNLYVMEGSAHAPFMGDPERFNREVIRIKRVGIK